MANDNHRNLEELLAQQTSLAKFGEFALKSDDLSEILQEACGIVSEALRTDLAKVMELRDDGRCTVPACDGLGRLGSAADLRSRSCRRIRAA